LYHGTDLLSADDLLQHGVDAPHAAAWSGSGEFWATTDPGRADWFARSHPNSPPGARFEFDRPELAFRAILALHPPGAQQHAPNDYEFFPPCYSLLNQYLLNPQVVLVP
jgi:hypothetical protein